MNRWSRDTNDEKPQNMKTTGMTRESGVPFVSKQGWSRLTNDENKKNEGCTAMKVDERVRGGAIEASGRWSRLETANRWSRLCEFGGDGGG